MHIGEIVSLHIGGAGCAVGDALWRRRETSNFPPEFFQEEDEQSYRPRAVFADLDPCVKETVSRQFHDKIVAGKEDASCMYTAGYLKSSTADRVIERLRGELERCDRANGLMVTHALGGGTGSGFATRILEQVREHFPQLTMMSWSSIPSEFRAQTVETYNATWTLGKLRSIVDMHVLYDNDAVCSALDGTPAKSTFLHTPKELKAVNEALASAMTSCGSATLSMRLLADTLTPVHDGRPLNLLSLYHAPMQRAGEIVYDSPGAYQLTRAAFKRTLLMPGDHCHTNILSAHVAFSGHATAKDVNRAYLRLLDDGELAFSPGMSTASSSGRRVSLNMLTHDNDNEQMRRLSQSVVGCSPVSVTSLVNSAETVVPVLRRVLETQRRMWRKRAFVSHFVDAFGGNDEEFVADYKEAMHGVACYINDYEAVGNASLGDIDADEF